MNETKVIVLGLDGATFDILTPLLKVGKLPRCKTERIGNRIIEENYSL